MGRQFGARRRVQTLSVSYRWYIVLCVLLRFLGVVSSICLHISRSRNIKVFSSHAAFTIEHDHKNSAGRDLTVSYHENDHYNSVRDSSVSKPSPPSIFPVEKASAQSSKVDDGADVRDNLEVQTTSESPVQQHASLKKNDPCHCGSGLRYKKCCLSAQKRSERLGKWKAKYAGETTGSDTAPSEDDSSAEMDGQFAVLKI